MTELRRGVEGGEILVDDVATQRPGESVYAWALRNRSYQLPQGLRDEDRARYLDARTVNMEVWQLMEYPMFWVDDSETGRKEFSFGQAIPFMEGLLSRTDALSPAEEQVLMTLFAAYDLLREPRGYGDRLSYFGLHNAFGMKQVVEECKNRSIIPAFKESFDAYPDQMISGLRPE